MNNCVDLNLNIEPLQDTKKLVSLKFYSHYKLPKEDINIELTDLLLNYGIEISHAESFYSPPNFNQPIHIDGLGGDISKLNFVYNGRGSKMNWYKEKPNIEVITKKTIIGTLYKEFSVNQVELIESHTIAFPSLVQVGIPHNVVNSYEPRLCVSIVLSDTNKKFLPMKEATEIFKEYIGTPDRTRTYNI